MKNEENIIYLSDYVKNTEKVKIIDQLDKDFSAINPKTHLIKRGLALVIDLCTIGLLNVGLHNGYALFVSEFLKPLNYESQLHLIQGNLSLSIGIFLVTYFTYFFYCTFILSGKTLGKIALGLKVIKEDFVHNMQDNSYELDLKDSFHRAAGYLLCYLSFGVFFVFNFASEDKRGLPDYLSNSRTVSDAWLKQMLEYKVSQQEHITINISELKRAA